MPRGRRADMTIKRKLAEHFYEDEERFFYWPDVFGPRNGRVGWHYRPVACGHYFFLGKSLNEIQESTYWAVKKLPGRDTF